MQGELGEKLSHEIQPLEDSSTSSSDEHHPTSTQAELRPRGLKLRNFGLG